MRWAINSAFGAQMLRTLLRWLGKTGQLRFSNQPRDALVAVGTIPIPGQRNPRPPLEFSRVDSLSVIEKVSSPVLRAL